MKQIVNNKYIKVYRFSSNEERTIFFNNQNIEKSHSIKDSFGENYYCFVCYHSLTQEKEFALIFESDESEENLNVLFWSDMLVMDTGSKVYFINKDISFRNSFEITTPLIGIYLINNEKLLLLEETYMRIISDTGQIVNSEMFDLIDDFSIENNLLSIKVGMENKIIDLNW